MNDFEGFFSEGVLGTYLSARQFPRYQVVDARGRAEDTRIFLYQRVEEVVLEKAYEMAGEGSLSKSHLQAAASSVLDSDNAFGVVTLHEAVVNYGFIPKGFSEATISAHGGSSFGRTLVSDFDGVVVCCFARNAHEFSDLVNAIVTGGSIKSLVESIEQKCNRESVESLAAVHSRSGQQIIVRVFGCRILEAMAMAGSDTMISMIGSGEQRKDVTAEWASEEFVRLGLLNLWDEEPPMFIASLMTAAIIDRRYSRWAARALDRYLEKPPLTKILRLWVDFSQEVWTSADHDSIGYAVGRLLSDSDNDPLIASGYSISEWLARRAALSADKSGWDADRVKRRTKSSKQVKEAIETRYLELSEFKPDAVAWAWDRYIRSTEQAEADTVYEETYRIDFRQRDPVFLCYLAFKPAVTSHIFMDIWGDVTRVSIPTVDGPVEANTKAFYLAMGDIVKAVLSSSSADKLGVIEETCFHLRDILWAVRASWALVEAATDHARGHTVMTSKDIEYCERIGVPVSIRLDKTED